MSVSLLPAACAQQQQQQQQQREWQSVQDRRVSSCAGTAHQSREQQQADDASVQRSLQRLARAMEVGQMSVSLDPPPVLCKGKGKDKGCGKGKDKGEGTGSEKKIR